MQNSIAELCGEMRLWEKERNRIHVYLCLQNTKFVRRKRTVLCLFEKNLKTMATIVVQCTMTHICEKDFVFFEDSTKKEYPMRQKDVRSVFCDHFNRTFTHTKILALNLKWVWKCFVYACDCFWSFMWFSPVRMYNFNQYRTSYI